MFPIFNVLSKLNKIDDIDHYHVTWNAVFLEYKSELNGFVSRVLIRNLKVFIIYHIRDLQKEEWCVIAIQQAFSSVIQVIHLVGLIFSDSGIKGCIGQVLVGIVVRLDPHLISMLD